MKIYIIGGRAKTGKNTLGTYLREELKDYGYKPCVMNLTAPLYSYAANYFDWDAKRDEKPREFLQKMGIEIIKEKLHKKSFLLDRLMEDIEILSNFFNVFIITDARLKIELETLKRNYQDVITIKLNRDNYDDQLTKEQKEHITETEIDTYTDFNYIINNTSLIALRKEAKKIINIEEKKGVEVL